MKTRKPAAVAPPPARRSPRSQPPQPRTPWTWKPFLAAGLLVLITLATYAPTLNDGFIWDDDYYVIKNVTLRSAHGLWRMWFVRFSLPQYYPLVHTTFWIEYHLWGLRPVGYHVVNVLLHATSVVLLWRLLKQLNLPGAWLAAAIFAVHPVMVESVAWITERKNVLSLALSLGSMLCYLRFAPLEKRDGYAPQEPVAGRRRWYALSLLLFMGALLSKSVVATVPAVLLVIDWWKNGRITARDVVRLLPFFAAGIAFGLHTAWLEKHFVGAKGDEWSFSLVERTLIAGRVVWFYAGKLLWPHPIIFFYRRWEIDAHVWWQYLFPLAVLAVLIVLWLARRRIGRGPLAAALIFIGVLTPALGFLNVFPFRFSFVADHFQYHASLALIALAAAGLATTAQRLIGKRSPTGEQPSDDAGEGPVPEAKGPLGWRIGLSIAAGALLLTLGTMSCRQTFAYYDLYSLYHDILRKNPDSWTAALNLGVVMMRDGKKDQALVMFSEALRANPTQSKTHMNYAQFLLDAGRENGFEPGELQQIINHFEVAIRLEPRSPMAELGLGMALMEDKQFEAARPHIERALKLDPFDPLALVHMGLLLNNDKKWNEALPFFVRAARVRPDMADAFHGIGGSLLQLNRPQESIAPLEMALQINPELPGAHYKLGDALVKVGELSTAIEQYHEELRLHPDHLDALSNLGVAYGMSGQLDMAIECFERLLKIDPNHKGAQANLESARKLLSERAGTPAAAP